MYTIIRTEMCIRDSCVGMGSKLFPGDKVAAEDWAYVTAKCKEALGYIAEARANK